MRPRVKLCGVTRAEDARHAAALGVDAVGFNFVPDSPRCIPPERAREIAAVLPAFILRVGVFADAGAEVIRDTARRAALHCAQLHGSEDPQACAALGLPWYKAHRVSPGFRLEEIARYASSTFLLDTWSAAGRGGTGETFDWEVARRAASCGRVILAGGLSPDNIREAIVACHPYAVDVNSGVESAPGRKDPALLGRFMQRLGEDPASGTRA